MVAGWYSSPSAGNLVAGDTNGNAGRLRARPTDGDDDAGQRGTRGHTGEWGSWGPTISANGRWIAFQSGANNLVPGDTNIGTDLFVHDQLTGTTTLVNVGPGGAQPNRDIDSPRISADGRWVVFHSAASNLVAGDTNNQSDVFVHDLQTGATTRASVGPGGVQGDGDSRFPVISGDGRWVAFFSSSSNLVPNDVG